MPPKTSSSPLMPTLYGSPHVTIILAFIILVLFFFGFFAIYLCRCVMGSILRAWHFRRSPSGNLRSVACASTSQGLDPSHIQTFPTFKYSSVKDFRKEKYGLECAICLCEFQNESMLRLLTLCYHVFHQECIDLWLESHNTCPVCRRLLEPAAESFGKASASPSPGNDPVQEAIAIDVRGDEGEKVGLDGRGEVVERRFHGDADKEDEKEEDASASGVEKCEGKLSRSNTTGHSIGRSREGEDRYTLRVPDHVKSRLLRGHNWTGSCTTFGDISRNKASASYVCGGDIEKPRGN